MPQWRSIFSGRARDMNYNRGYIWEKLVIRRPGLAWEYSRSGPRGTGWGSVFRGLQLVSADFRASCCGFPTLLRYHVARLPRCSLTTPRPVVLAPRCIRTTLYARTPPLLPRPPPPPPSYLSPGRVVCPLTDRLVSPEPRLDKTPQ